MKKPKKWTEIYPQGTKEGDEEQAFWIALARNKKWEWRSTAQIVKESGLERSRVEEILNKYVSMKPPLIFPCVTKDDHWAYWERVPHLVKDTPSLTNSDKKKRIGQELDGDLFDWHYTTPPTSI